MTPTSGPSDALSVSAAPATLSVGELIRQADVTARMLMLDIDGRAAAAMVRTWPEVVEATADLWRALPREDPATDNRDRLNINRLQALSRGLHLSMIRHHSHPAAAGDPRLGDIVDLLERAHDLVDKFRDEVDPVTSPAARGDLSAAKMTLVHALYVGSHAVASSVQAHVDVVADLVRGPYQATQLAHGPQLLQRLRAFEQITGSYLTGRYARTIQAAALDPPPGVERLDDALHTWDLTAHQTLAR